LAIGESLLTGVVCELMRQASTDLPADPVRALTEAWEKEDEGSTGKHQLGAILESQRISRDKCVGICQDTGVPLFYLDLGTNCRLEGDPQKAIAAGVAEATKIVPLRQNVINPLTKKNSGNNTGWGIPYLHWDVEPDKDYLDIMAVPKGFGSEMRALTSWILTSENVGRAAVKVVLDVVEDAMGEPCPPIIIGVGIGGFADSSAAAAKKALFRNPIGSRNPDPVVAALEEEINTAVNDLGLGPMGFGGKTYCLGTHIEIMGSHTAVVPVSVVFQCWACRYASARIYNDGTVKYISHPDNK